MAVDEEEGMARTVYIPCICRDSEHLLVFSFYEQTEDDAVCGLDTAYVTTRIKPASLWRRIKTAFLCVFRPNMISHHFSETVVSIAHLQELSEVINDHLLQNKELKALYELKKAKGTNHGKSKEVPDSN